MKRALIMIGLVAAAVALIWLLRARTERGDTDAVAQKRDERARRAEVIEVAVVWSGGEPRLWNGARLALADLQRANAPCRGVPVRGRGCLPLRLRRYSPSLGDEIKTARRIARSTQYVAVIGHTSSDIAAFAAVSYEVTGIVFLATSSTDPSLTNRSEQTFVFRTTQDDVAFAEVIAREIAAHRISPPKAGLLYTRTRHYLVTPYLDRLIDALTEQGIDPGYEKPYPLGLVPPRDLGASRRRWLRNTDAVRRLLSSLDRGEDVPVMLLLDDYPSNAARVLPRIAAMTPSPIVLGAASTDGVERFPPLASLRLQSQCMARYTAGSAGWQRQDLAVVESNLRPPVYTASLFCASAPELAPLAARYREATGTALDSVSLQGYEAVRILAAALADAESIAPIDVAARLRSGKPLALGTRSVAFAANGDITGQPIFIRGLRVAQ